MANPEEKDASPEEERSSDEGTQITHSPLQEEELATQQIDVTKLREEEPTDPNEKTQADISIAGLKIDEGTEGT